MGRQTCCYFLDFEEEELDGDLVPFRPERSSGRLDGSHTKNQGEYLEATAAGDVFGADDAWNVCCCAVQSDYRALLQDPSDLQDSLADPRGGMVSG
jgi:hypothetical protein